MITIVLYFSFGVEAASTAVSAACVDMLEPRDCSVEAAEAAVTAECHGLLSDAETRVATSVISQSSDISESGMSLSTTLCAVMVMICVS